MEDEEEELRFRRAEASDLQSIVALLVDDDLGGQREDAGETLGFDATHDGMKLHL